MPAWVPHVATHQHVNYLLPDALVNYLLPDALVLLTADQRRLPIYARSRWHLNIFLIVASAASAVVAYAGYGAWVAAISATSTVTVSWTEFAGFQRKLARYTGE